MPKSKAIFVEAAREAVAALPAGHPDKILLAYFLRGLNTVSRLVDLFATGKGNDGDDMADVFNAITDFYSHESIKSDPWRQFVSSEFGVGQAVKARAYTALTSAGGRKELSERGEAILALS